MVNRNLKKKKKIKSQAKDSFKVICRFLRTDLDWINKAVRKTPACDLDILRRSRTKHFDFFTAYGYCIFKL